MKRKGRGKNALLSLCFALTLAACAKGQMTGDGMGVRTGQTEPVLHPDQNEVTGQTDPVEQTEVPQINAAMEQMRILAEDLNIKEMPLNYGTTYEVFVYSFYDSDGDGIGDLEGVIQKLDYINDGEDGKGEDLEVNAIWLMPVFASPTYHKYDVTDYLAIDEQYGTVEDLKRLIEAAHERGVRVILDMPINHTSSEHPWFREACEYLESLDDTEVPDATVCPYVDYYHFTESVSGGYSALNDRWYYEAQFWSGMPDLNLDSKAVREEIRNIFRYWLECGADGFRLDAVTSYYTGSNGSNTEFMVWVNETVKEIRQDAYIVGEAWTDQNTYASFYASGVDSFFDFAFAGNDGYIAKAVKGSITAESLVEKMEEEEQLYRSYSQTAVNAPFYTNHDMARSTGYYTDDEEQTKLAGGLNLLMTGNAFLYYGEEIGMKGSGADENKRAPMYWSVTDDTGICAGPPDMGNVRMVFSPQDEQSEDPFSIWNYFKTAIRIRNAFPVIASGSTYPVHEMCGETYATFIRRSDTEYESVLIVINTGEEAVQVAFDGEGCGYTHMAAVLLTGSDTVTADKDVIEIPGRGIAVMIREE